MPNIVNLQDFIKRFNNYKKLSKVTITLRTKVLDDIINYIEKADMKIAILLVQKINLINALKDKGVSDEMIRKILEVKGEEDGKV